MPSRKKAKGKARKAAKEAKAKEEESQAVVEVAADQRQKEPLETQMQQLAIDNVTSQQCQHGYPLLSTDEKKICDDFLRAFIAAFNTQEDLGRRFTTALHFTMVEYDDVYSSKLDTVVSMLVAGGTLCILGGDNSKAKAYAAFACYFEEWMAVCLRKNKAIIKTIKVAELYSADDHTLVSYYKKRISCGCLDEIYKEVKSVKKMGLCFNPNCSQGREIERSKMFSCTHCNEANYCSVECQKVDWKTHREECGTTAETKAAFKSRQT